MGGIVAIIGNKGGTGKTTLSHLIAHGLGLFQRRAVAVLTDTWRDRLSKTHRNYLPFDARAPEDLARAAANLRSVDQWTGIIDGGGNRPDMDEHLAAMADLVILPFRESHEDIRTVMKDLARFPRAYALPSQWPTNAWAANAARRTIDTTMAIHKDRLLAPVNALSATKLLLQHELPPSLPRALDNAAREIALQVLELLGEPLPDTDWLPRMQAPGAGRAPSVLHA